MSVSDRCPVCDRPEATAEQWARVERDENIPAAEGASVCWGEGEPQCLTARVDWRARALAAEAQRDEARRLLAAAACGKLRRCETCGERLATRRWRGTDVDVCDRCFDEDKRDAADGWETLDEEACEDLPHAAALRAAMEAAK